VLAHPAVHDRLVAELGRAVRAFYGQAPADRRHSPDYGRIINGRHLDRLRGLLAASGGRIELGGEWDAADNYFAPTVVTGVPPDAPLMREEIFGPILPVLAIADMDAAVRFVNARPRPLALYVFTGRKATAEAILAGTAAGGSCVNDTVLHFTHPGLPAGGVGGSGIGKAHGLAGFEAFSNARGILRSPARYSPAQWLYPPYTAGVRRLIDLTMRYL
jgi:aldehyde dehydrogenase (NAD+)